MLLRCHMRLTTSGGNSALRGIQGNTGFVLILSSFGEERHTVKQQRHFQRNKTQLGRCSVQVAPGSAAVAGGATNTEATAAGK